MNTQSRVLKWALILGIVIVLNLFFNYTLSLVYSEPEYEAYCPNREQVVKAIETEEACLGVGGQWNENVYYPRETIEKVPAGYCDTDFTCRNEYTDARKVYDRNVFLTLVILGALSVAAGAFLKGNAVLGIALSFAGVLSFIIASMRYWNSADTLIKVLILAIALLILIWVAMKRFKDSM